MQSTSNNRKGLIILKLGGSIITYKNSEKPRKNNKTITRIVKEIAEAYPHMKHKLLLVHGAGSYGHPIVNRTNIIEGIKNDKQLLDLSKTQLLQTELNLFFSHELLKYKLPIFPIQASASSIMHKTPKKKESQLVELSCSAIEGLLGIGMIPLFYGVPSFDIKQKCSILSGDQIAPYLAKRLGASRILHATIVDGVFRTDIEPNEVIPEIIPSDFEQVKKWITDSKITDVTGSMAGKVKPLVDLAEYFHIESAIFNGNTQGLISRALIGEKGFGTIIAPD